jgi:hypothetical protein
MPNERKMLRISRNILFRTGLERKYINAFLPATLCDVNFTSVAGERRVSLDVTKHHRFSDRILIPVEMAHALTMHCTT